MKFVLISLQICIFYVTFSLTNSICGNNRRCEDRLMHPDSPGPSYQSKNAELNNEKNNEFWLENAKEFVNEQLSREVNEKPAKNIIYFLGDGMSLTTLAASRIVLGGEEKFLSFEKFPYTGLVRTYCLDKKVPDSASTATSYLTGVKANYGTIGYNGHVNRGKCDEDLKKFETHSIGKLALEHGKAAGIVTTTRVTHASPAGVYAHIPDREWEAEIDKGCKAKLYDVCDQLVNGEVGSKLKVILGGGRRSFLDKTMEDEDGEKGKRSDKRNLIEEWKQKNIDGSYVTNREQLMKIDAKKTDKLLGLFHSSHMLYHLEAEHEGLSEEKPTLAEMTQKAIEVLQKDKNGFFLFVEGGRIDMAHHAIWARTAIDETIEFSKAVEKAFNMTNPDETLIVVTSDHSHTFSISGYPARNNDIFSVTGKRALDYLPYMTLSYANGQGFENYYESEKNFRKDPKTNINDDYRMEFPSTVPLYTETHGGEDVAVFANGPWAHLFTGAYEQNVLPHLMAYAACLDDENNACK